MPERTCRACGSTFARVPEPGRPRVRCYVCLPKRKPVGPKVAIRRCIQCEAQFHGTKLSKYCSQRCKDAAKPKVPCSRCGGPSGHQLSNLSRVADIDSVVCQPCRRADWQHGTQKGYRRAGCRCDECRQWARESMAAYIAMVKQRDGLTPRVKYRKTPDVHCIDCGDRLRFGGGGRGDAPPRCLACSRRRPYIAKSLRQSVFDRDAWTCQLCSGPTEPAADPRSDWYPTLDHIIPYSKGGPDTAENLRTAHRWCNLMRGAGDRHADLFEEAS